VADTPVTPAVVCSIRDPTEPVKKPAVGTGSFILGETMPTVNKELTLDML